MRVQTRSEIRRVLDKHDVSPSKRLGQHFLADPNITRKVVSVAGVGPNERVLEIGAGTGTLTCALAETGAHVVSYEIDERLRPVLEEVTDGVGVELRFADVTRVDLAAETRGGSWVMVANLPYNVGTPLVMDALRFAHNITRFVVMVQLEVGERFTAAPGSPDYGLPSVVAGIHATASVAFKVPPQVFFPPPRVESAVVVMERKQAPREAERAIELARAGFGLRRKMLRGSLSDVLDHPEASLRQAGLDPTWRAEDLSPNDYLRLARVA